MHFAKLYSFDTWHTPHTLPVCAAWTLWSAHGELLWSINVRRPACVVRRQQFALKAYSSYTPKPISGGHFENLFFASPEPKGQLTWNSVGNIGVISRSKITKIVPIGNPRGVAAILKIYFSLLPLTRKANWLETRVERSGWLVDQK